MKPVHSEAKRATVSARFVVAMVMVFLVPLLIFAAPPTWWSEQQVLEEGTAANDYAAINQGQLKNLAKKAYAAMQAKLPATVWSKPEGVALSGFVGGLTNSPSNYNAVNLGQLKHTAHFFYDALNAAGYTNSAFHPYPWSVSTAAKNDYALANIGQTKNVFAFDLPQVPDWWQLLYFGQTGIDPEGNPDGDDLTNLQEYLQGKDPLVADGGTAPDPGGSGNIPAPDDDPSNPNPEGEVPPPSSIRIYGLSSDDPTRVEIEWEAPSGGASYDYQYVLEKKESAGAWIPFATLPKAFTRMPDSVKYGLRTHYRVKCVLPDSRESDWVEGAWYLPVNIKGRKYKFQKASGLKSVYSEYIDLSNPRKMYLEEVHQFSNVLDDEYSEANTWIHDTRSELYNSTTSYVPTPDPGNGWLQFKQKYEGTYTEDSIHNGRYWAGDSYFHAHYDGVQNQNNGTWDFTYTYTELNHDYGNTTSINTSSSWGGGYYNRSGGSLISMTKTKKEYYFYTYQSTSTSSNYQEVHDTYTLSKEYMIDSFMEDVFASLTEWSDDWLDYVPVPYWIAYRRLSKDELTFSVQNAQYKYTASSSSAGYTYKWAEIFVEDEDPNNPTPEEDRTSVTNRSWTVDSEDSQPFTINVHDRNQDKSGVYYLGGVSSLNVTDGYGGTLDQGEKAASGARVPLGGASGGSSATFTIIPTSVPGATYTLQHSGGGSIRVYAIKSDGSTVIAPTSFSSVSTASNYIGNYSSFFVVATGQEYNDQAITVTLTATAKDGSDAGTDSCVFYYKGQPVPPVYVDALPDEASGAKYRKIALNGRPLPDSKPQSAEESDQQAEETFVDALTLGLRHSTTDIYVPVPGSEMALAVRRNTQSEVWSVHDGLRPHERPDQPFGVAWNSNLISGIHFVQRLGSNSHFAGQPKADPDEAYVTDENGASYRFAMWTDLQGNRKFFPFPTARNEQAAYLTSLVYDADQGLYIFKRKFGSTLIFEPVPLDLTVAADRMAGSMDSVKNTYARLKTVTDRLNYTLRYAYETATTLVPKTIVALDGSGAPLPDQTISIQQNAQGLVTAIWDPNWNKTAFSYEHDDIRNIWKLVKVTPPDQVTASNPAGTHYTYSVIEEDDLTPRLPVQHFKHIHCDVSSITDPNGKTYTIEYELDHTRWNHKVSTAENINAYYIATGRPSTVKSVALPDSIGVAHFDNQSFVKLAPNADGHAALTSDSQRKTVVTDAAGNIRTYTWPTDKALVVQTTDFGTLYGTNRTFGSTTQNIVLYREMQIQYGAGSGQKEIFTFDENAGMNVKSVTDLSGNLTTYAYTDTWTIPTGNPYREVLPAETGINGVYEDPTSQTNARTKTKTFTYNSQRIMQSVIDEEGRKTVYSIDAKGRRTSETIYATATSSTWAQYVEFKYENAAFPGFLTKKIVFKRSGDPGTDLVTQYVPDEAGRLKQEIIDPGGLNLTTSYTYDKNGSKLSATDPRENTTSFVYDKRSRLTEVHYPATESGTGAKYLRYDARGNKVKELDENRHATLFEYDALNRVVTQARDMDGNQQINAGDLITRFTYNAVNSKRSTTDPNGTVTAMDYDSLQRLTTLTQSQGVLNYVTTFEYSINSGGSAFDSSAFKPTRSVDPRGYVTTVTYDALYRPTDKKIQYDLDSGATSLTLTTYDEVGNMKSVTDPRNHTTWTNYDALNRPILVTNPDSTTQVLTYSGTGLKWQMTDELGRTTETLYDTAGRATTVSGPLVNGVHPITRAIYDAAGNVTATINPLGKQWDYTYDARNRKTQEQQPAVANGPGGAMERPTFKTGYDLAGNVVSVTDPRGYVTTTTYDAANRKLKVTQPEVDVAGGGKARPITSMTYDANGNVRTLTDPNLHVTTNTYSSLNQLTETKDAKGILVKNEYDAANNRIAVVDGENQRTEFTYDGLNRLTTTKDPANKLTTLTYDGLVKIARQDSIGHITGYGYDSRNRLTSLTYSGRTADNRYYNYDNVGNLSSVTQSNPLANVGYTYDTLNRQITETSAGITSSYSYDLAGNRVTTTYGGTLRVLTSAYDDLNRLTTLTDSSRVSTYAYDLNGNIVQKALPNGDKVLSAFDAINRTATLSGRTSGNNPLYTYFYSYDPVGNVKSISETYPGGINNRTLTNTYDEINRLTNEAITTGTNSVTTTYIYDDAHNRTTKAVTGGSAPGTTTYSYNQLNQLTTVSGLIAASYTYDDNGNRLTQTRSGVTDNYTYDYENRLVTLVKNITGSGLTTGTYQYTYDYRTRRVLRDETAAGGVQTKLVFSGGTSSQEYTVTGTNSSLIVEYIRGSDYGGGIGGVLYTLRGGTPSYTHENRRGDVIAKTDGNGSLTYQATYEAYGKRTQESGSTLDRQKANTKDEDPTGLLNEGFRYRDLETGTFITRDPLMFVDGPNMYAYVVCNPWTSFDPEGLATLAINDNPEKPKETTMHQTTQQPAPKPAEKPDFRSNDEVISQAQQNIQQQKTQPTQSAKDISESQIKQAVDDNRKNPGMDKFPGPQAYEFLLRSGLFAARHPEGLQQTKEVLDWASLATVAGMEARAALMSSGLMRTAETASALKPVVIGENMPGRVTPFAKGIGAETYQPGPFKNFADSMRQQKAWIENMAAEGRPIINIGPDLARPNFSPYYDLETTTLENMRYPTINAPMPPSGPPVR